MLYITEIDIHKSEECRHEWVEVRDGYMPDAPSLGRICGSGKGPVLRSTRSRLTVVYQPGPKPKPHKGFKAHYEGKSEEENSNQTLKFCSTIFLIFITFVNLLGY